MITEYEIKLLDIDLTEAKARLSELGFSNPEQINFRRYVYDLPTQKGTWLRLRTDGKITTLTRKEFRNDSIDGVHEHEIEVTDFQTCHELLVALGYKESGYQENRRLLYKNAEVEIAIDEWPRLKPYLEIEANNEATVQKYLRKLKIQHSGTTSRPTSYLYKLAGHDLSQIKHLAY